jgi:hypothetical protein
MFLHTSCINFDYLTAEQQQSGTKVRLVTFLAANFEEILGKNGV